METIEITIGLIKIRTGIIIIIIGKTERSYDSDRKSHNDWKYEKSLSIEEFVIMTNKTIVL